MIPRAQTPPAINCQAMSPATEIRSSGADEILPDGTSMIAPTGDLAGERPAFLRPQGDIFPLESKYLADRHPRHWARHRSHELNYRIDDRLSF
jgi:hypothetical protein